MSTHAKQCILVVDDEPEILRALRAGLMAQGYEVETAVSGTEALQKATAHVPDMIILDMVLPDGMDGLEVCRRLREWSQMPILILSALGQERQKVAALDLGADDYLTKPFGMDELTARVRAALRRTHAGTPQTEAPLFEWENLKIDYVRRLAFRSRQELKLTPLEYDILRFLTRNADRVVTHRAILNDVWGIEYSEDIQLLRVHIGHLRQKIEENPARPRLIVTEPGVGYRFKTTR